VRESQRSAKGRPHTLNGQAGGYQVIGPGHHPSPSPGVGQVPGHRSALGADGLQGPSAQVDGCLTAAVNVRQSCPPLSVRAHEVGLTGGWRPQVNRVRGRALLDCVACTDARCA